MIIKQIGIYERTKIKVLTYLPKYLDAVIILSLVPKSAQWFMTSELINFVLLKWIVSHSGQKSLPSEDFTLYLNVLGLWSFQTGYIKLESFFASESTYPKEIGLMGSHQIKVFKVDYFILTLFLVPNLFNFIHPVWKLHNPYCHIVP